MGFIDRTNRMSNEYEWIWNLLFVIIIIIIMIRPLLLLRWQAKPRSKFAGEKITHGLKLEDMWIPVVYETCIKTRCGIKLFWRSRWHFLAKTMFFLKGFLDNGITLLKFQATSSFMSLFRMRSCWCLRFNKRHGRCGCEDGGAGEP